MMPPEEQALLRALLDTAVDAIIVIDERGNVQRINPATTSMFGYQPDEVIGRNIKMLMPTPYHENHDQYLHHYRETGHRHIIGVGREVTGKRKDESQFPLHLAVSEVWVGSTRLYAGILRDISDVKAAESELKRLNEALEQRVRERTRELHAAQAELVRKEKLATLGQVAGGIAHEIRNPLNAVKTSAYYLKNAKTISPGKMQEHLDRIDRQVTIIDNVVTALADVARLPEPRQDRCDIRQILSDAIAVASVPDEVKIDIQLPPTLPSVLVDPFQIPIVFRNLIRNACDAMPDGGTLAFVGSVLEDTQPNWSFVSIDVIDTGTGIMPERLEKIMDPFFSTKARGMGLGLSITKAILEKNGGQLSVSSEENKGTRFSVKLRVASPDAPHPNANPNPRPVEGAS